MKLVLREMLHEPANAKQIQNEVNETMKMNVSLAEEMSESLHHNNL